MSSSGHRRGRSGAATGADATAADPVVATAPVADDENADLQCPLCLDYPEGHVSQCPNGHIFCADCLKTHQAGNRGPVCQKCPTCRAALPTEPIRNRIAERAIGNLPGPCPGCGTSMLRKDIIAHKATCADIMVKCPFPTCQVHVRRRDLEAHLADGRAHLQIAEAMHASLLNAHAVLDGLTVKVTIKTPTTARGIPVDLKYMEPINGQATFLAALVGTDVHNVAFGAEVEITKSPHELGLRDGASIMLSPVVNAVDAISLRVVTQDEDEVFFKLRPTTELRKMFVAFCQRQGISQGGVRFSFDGQRISNWNTTPADWGMEDCDAVDVIEVQ